jgi:hypothetical protein
MTKYYAGVGSRQTPENILHLMTRIAMRMAELGWVLRSGGAKGADYAFEKGAGDKKEIYLPWRGFGGSNSEHIVGSYPRLREIAEKHHPAWQACSAAAKSLHTRNVAQILGDSKDSSPSTCVICWTPEGKGGGGTGQAIRIAHSYGIPVFDLYFGVDPLAKFMLGLPE